MVTQGNGNGGNAADPTLPGSVMTDTRPCSSDADQRISRRTVLFGVASTLFAGPTGAFSATRPPRLAVIDWAAAETMLAFGIIPVGIADRAGFLASFANPGDIGDAVDLGSLWEPNLELLDMLRPDAIYLAGWSQISKPQLQGIAPVRICDIHGGGGDPVTRARTFTRNMAIDFPKAPGRRTLEMLDQRLAGLTGRLAPASAFVLNLHGNNRFVNVYAEGSLPGSVLGHLGLTNAWQGGVNGFGFAAIGIEKLMDAPDSSIIILNQGPATVRSLSMLGTNAIWNALPAVRQGRVHVSPPISVFGGLVSAVILADWLTTAFRDTP